VKKKREKERAQQYPRFLSLFVEIERGVKSNLGLICFVFYSLGLDQDSHLGPEIRTDLPILPPFKAVKVVFWV